MVFLGCGMVTQRWLDWLLLGLAQVTATVSHRYLIAPVHILVTAAHGRLIRTSTGGRSKGTVYNKRSSGITKSQHASGSESANELL